MKAEFPHLHALFMCLASKNVSTAYFIALMCAAKDGCNIAQAAKGCSAERVVEFL